MIRGLWTRETIGWLTAFALLPPAAVLLAIDGGPAALRLAAALAAGLFWQALFRATLGVPFAPSGAVTAVAIAVLGSPDFAPWQAMLGASFGLVIAELVFGGWGRNVVAAPVAALAFLSLSFPGFAPPAPEPAMALAAVASGLLLLATGILALLVAAAALIAWLGGLAAGGVVPAEALTSGAFAFALVFLIGDPVAAAATPSGRLLYGALAGALAAILALSGAGAAAPGPVIFAALLAQIFAPLLDHAAVATWHARRTRRHG